MSGRKMSVRMIVGLADGDTLPTIAGCMDELIWEIVGAEESDAAFAEMRHALDAAGGIPYQWREIVVHLDADALLAHFKGQPVEAEVPAPEEAR